MLTFRAMWRISLPLLLLLSLPRGHAADIVAGISEAEWARPRSAATLVRMPALANMVAEYSRAPSRQLLIRYPGGEEGVLWAEELRDWLVALGIPSSKISISPGAVTSSQLELSLGSASAWP